MANVNEVSEQVLDDVGLARDGRRLNGVLVQLVLLGQSNGLLPALVLAVDVSGNLAEEDEVVLLKATSQVHGIVVVVVLYRIAESLVVFLLDEQIVDSLVDSALVLALDVKQEGLDQRQAVVLLEHLDNTVDIDASSEAGQEVGKQGRMLLDVELDGTVVNFQVGNLDADLLELLVVPGVLGTLDNGQGGVVELVVVVVAEDQLGPQVCFLAGTDHLGHVHSGPEDLDVLHQALRVVLGQGNTKLGEHTHVSTLKAETLLEQADEFVEVSVVLVVLDKFLQLLGINNQVKTANLGKAEFLLANTGSMNLLPDLDVVGLAGTVNSSLVVAKVNQGGGKLGPVGNAAEENLGSLVQALFVSLVTRFFNVGDVGGSQEVLKLGQLVEAGVAEGKSSIDRRLTQRLAGHAEILDEVFVLASVSGSLNDFLVVLGVIGLDVRLNGVGDADTVQLSLGHLAPDFRNVDLLSISLSTVNADDVLDKNVNGSRLVVSLLVDLEGFLVQTDVDTRGCNLVGVVAVELVDVVHHAALISLGGSEQKQVLEVLVVAER